MSFGFPSGARKHLIDVRALRLSEGLTGGHFPKILGQSTRRSTHLKNLCIPVETLRRAAILDWDNSGRAVGAEMKVPVSKDGSRCRLRGAATSKHEVRKSEGERKRRNVARLG